MIRFSKGDGMKVPSPFAAWGRKQDCFFPRNVV